MNSSEHSALIVDTSGTRCPIPLLKAKQALKSLQAGELIEVISTDPSSVGDFNAMLRHLPHELLEARTEQGQSGQTHYHFVIRKG